VSPLVAAVGLVVGSYQAPPPPYFLLGYPAYQVPPQYNFIPGKVAQPEVAMFRIFNRAGERI